MPTPASNSTSNSAKEAADPSPRKSPLDNSTGSTSSTIATEFVSCDNLMEKLTIHEADSSSDDPDATTAAPLSPADAKESSSAQRSAVSTGNKDKGKGSAKSKTSLKKSVSFHQVEVREYARTIGDHPDVFLGPPVTIDWESHHRTSRDIDEYESNRGERKNSIQMRMHPNTRKRMMLSAGVSKEDIKAATKAANKAQTQRKNTVAFLEVPIVGVVEEITQSACRKFKRRSWRSQGSAVSDASTSSVGSRTSSTGDLPVGDGADSRSQAASADV